MSVQTADCIETTWKRDRKGYGRKYIPGVGNRSAARWAWEQVNGPIPPGMLVCHHCDNPPCINVAHLFLGTPADNMHDRDAKGRTATGERNGSFHRRGIRRPGPRTSAPGEANSHAKLTEADVVAIRGRAAAGETGKAIALSLGLYPTTVQRIVSGKNWRHIA